MKPPPPPCSWHAPKKKKEQKTVQTRCVFASTIFSLAQMLDPSAGTGNTTNVGQQVAPNVVLIESKK